MRFINHPVFISFLSGSLLVHASVLVIYKISAPSNLTFNKPLVVRIETQSTHQGIPNRTHRQGQFVPKSSAHTHNSKPGPKSADRTHYLSARTHSGSRTKTTKNSLPSKRHAARNHKQTDDQLSAKQISSANPHRGLTRPPLYGLGSNNTPKPDYPYRARKKGWHGRVILHLTVSPSGHVTHLAINQSSGYRILDQAAFQTVQKWVLSPALKNGKPVSGTLNLPIIFQFDDE